MSNTRASAVCPTTSTSRAQCRLRVEPRPPSRKRMKSGADARSAGTAPHANAAKMAAPSVNQSVAPFRLTSASLGIPAGAALMNAGKVRKARPTARTAAAAATTTASVICSRTS